MRDDRICEPDFWQHCGYSKQEYLSWNTRDLEWKDIKDYCGAGDVSNLYHTGIHRLGDAEKVLPLPVAGIMSDLSYKEVSRRYTELERFAKELDSQLKAPFMTLSFMALLVIPEIKLSDKGLFDVLRFEFMGLFAS